MTDDPSRPDRTPGAVPPAMSGDEPTPGMPRWVKGFAVAGVVLVLLLVIMLLTGHGPGRHLGSSDGHPPDMAGLAVVAWAPVS